MPVDPSGAGKCSVKVVPSPAREETPMCPPCFLTMEWHTARPNPCPFARMIARTKPSGARWNVPCRAFRFFWNELELTPIATPDGGRKAGPGAPVRHAVPDDPPRPPRIAHRLDPAAHERARTCEPG